MITLESLTNQLNVLREDERKTKEKLFQIYGGIKIVEFMIAELTKELGVIDVKSEGANHA